LGYSAVEIADGAAFNSGQSCCAIERVYVHESVYDEFLRRIVEELKGYKLGDPNGTSKNAKLIKDLNTTKGPVVSTAAAERIRKQISDAVAAGAKIEIPEGTFPLDRPGSSFVGPQVLTNVNHNMSKRNKCGCNCRCDER
jgi:acyl-CoA reductase-like NAD-dependent aldehyde dehydrogenase